MDDVHWKCNCRLLLFAQAVALTESGLCTGTSLYSYYSFQTFQSSCIKEIFHLNNDLRTTNPFSAWFNTMVLLIWCLGLSNLHVKQQYFNSGTWMKSLAHEVKMTFPQKETNNRRESFWVLHIWSGGLFCMILGSSWCFSALCC